MHKALFSSIIVLSAITAGFISFISTAHAQITVTVGFPAPVVVAAPPVVYYPPAPVVYAPPRVVVAAPPVYYTPRVVYTAPVYRHRLRHHHHWR